MPGGLTQEEAEAAGVLYEHDHRASDGSYWPKPAIRTASSMTLVTSEMAAYRANYEVLQAELAEIGIDVKLEVVDHATMHAQIREDVNPIVIYVANRPNADST